MTCFEISWLAFLLSRACFFHFFRRFAMSIPRQQILSNYTAVRADLTGKVQRWDCKRCDQQYSGNTSASSSLLTHYQKHLQKDASEKAAAAGEGSVQRAASIATSSAESVVEVAAAAAAPSSGGSVSTYSQQTSSLHVWWLVCRARTDLS